MGIRVSPLKGSRGRGQDPRKFMNKTSKSGGQTMSKEDKRILKILASASGGRPVSMEDIENYKKMDDVERAMSLESNRTERLPENKMSGGPVKKKKKASSGYMGGGYVKPKMMGKGGMAYRGRTYAYGGRVSKYKG